jgi:hypothetical protein
MLRITRPDRPAGFIRVMVSGIYGCVLVAISGRATSRRSADTRYRIAALARGDGPSSEPTTNPSGRTAMPIALAEFPHFS